MYTTSPNPRVGCVIVNNGMVVGEGWHARAGQAHAEIHALQQAGDRARSATAYVTLEPCSHHGRTPPCADALLAAGVARVVAAMRDPNPKVAGSGLARLQTTGIDTASGLMETQARELNPGFIARMEKQRPWVRSKIAASLDGGTALENGVSQWITGAAARHDVHHWRARACAVLTGIGTVLADDPQMNVRDFETGRMPLRVVLDSQLRLPPDARILQDGGVLIVCRNDSVPQADILRQAGAEILALPGGDGLTDLPALLAVLAQREINELHVEAGSGVNGAMLRAGLIDELLLYLAPTLLGSAARGLFDFPALTGMSQRTNLDILALDKVGQDIRVRARPGNYLLTHDGRHALPYRRSRI